MSTGRNVSVPSAIAATAWTPPRTWISSAPARCIAAIVSGCGMPWFGGGQAGMWAAPATRPLAKHDAGQGLDLDITHRFALDLGKVADLRLREADVVESLRRDLLDHCGNVR